MAHTSSHSTSPFFVMAFVEIDLVNYLPGLASNLNPPDLCLPSSEDYRREPPAQGLALARQALFCSSHASSAQN
jgi:hypothetical protein